MSRFIACWVVLLVSLSLLTDTTWAVVVREPVTPASVKEKESKFSVKAEKREDGLIHFAITYSLPRPEYIVAHFELSIGGETLARSDTPAFVHEGTATYYVAVAPKHRGDAKFELSSNPFSEAGGQPVAMPGGAIYPIDLKAFAEEASVRKAE